MGSTFSAAPVRSHSICQGTMLEWCSMAVISTSSPLFTFERPNDVATRLMPSVVPRTNTISLVEGALMKARVFSRAPS